MTQLALPPRRRAPPHSGVATGHLHSSRPGPGGGRRRRPRLQQRPTPNSPSAAHTPTSGAMCARVTRPCRRPTGDPACRTGPAEVVTARHRTPPRDMCSTAHLSAWVSWRHGQRTVRVCRRTGDLASRGAAPSRASRSRSASRAVDDVPGTAERSPSGVQGLTNSGVAMGPLRSGAEVWYRYSRSRPADGLYRAFRTVRFRPQPLAARAVGALQRGDPLGLLGRANRPLTCRGHVMGTNAPSTADQPRPGTDLDQAHDMHSSPASDEPVMARPRSAPLIIPGSWVRAPPAPRMKSQVRAVKINRLWGIHLTGAGLFGDSPWPLGRRAVQGGRFAAVARRSPRSRRGRGVAHQISVAHRPVGDGELEDAVEDQSAAAWRTRTRTRRSPTDNAGPPSAAPPWRKPTSPLRLDGYP